MPLHWSVVQAICERDEQAAEEAMRKLVILTTDDIHRALSHHPHSEGEPQDGSW
jgi:GntR family transcriptional regulator, galactonate operon transcriptional repressor